MPKRLTVEEKIDRFIAKHPEPKMPTTRIWWMRATGRKTYIVGKGEPEINIRLGSTTMCQYYKVDEKLGLCELAIITIDTVHVPKGEIKWEYVNRFFIPKGTRDLYNRHGEQKNYRYYLKTYAYNTNSKSEFGRNFARLDRYGNLFEKVFLPFIGNDTKTSYTWSEHMYSTWQLEYWFKYQPKTRTTGKVQQTIDTLVQTELGNTDDIIKMITNKLNNNDFSRYWYNSGDKMAYFDKDHMVFRCFAKMGGQYIEDRRAYYRNNRFYTCVLTDDCGWVTQSGLTVNVFRYTVINPSDCYALPRTKYLEGLINDKYHSVYEISTIMKHPEFEQLVNMGAVNLAKNISRNYDKKYALLSTFGTPNKSTNICKKYGITAKQILYMNKQVKDATSQYYHVEGILKNMRRFTGISNISSIDYETFVKYFNTLQSVDSWRWDTILGGDDSTKKQLLDKLVRWHEKDSSVINIFTDTISTYGRISRDNRPETSPRDVKSLEELHRLHDTCVELKRIEDEENRRLWNMREAERNAELEKKMTKLNEERRKYNYEEENFLIRVPEKLVEITNEGSRLHHCVGGYVSNHAQGRTTIIFLRRKEDPDASFYTIEINNGRVIQIHGFGNKWLGNDPDAIPTVMRWLKIHNISCTDQILLSTAKGYCCGSAELVEKPVI